MEFTLTDKALMLRCARLLGEVAATEESTHGPVWAATKEGVLAKKRYDRLLRDQRDLRALVTRLEILHPPKAVPKELMEPSLSEQRAMNAGDGGMSTSTSAEG